MWTLVPGALLALMFTAPLAAAAQAPAASASKLTFAPALQDGDCVVTVSGVPDTADAGEVAVFVNGHMLTVGPARRNGDRARMKLREPLHENEVVTAELRQLHSDETRVLQAKQQDKQPRLTCEDPVSPDDRAVFEASGYIGRAFDNFAPASNTSYLPQKPGEKPSDEISSRMLAGVEAQYRLIGEKGHTFQIWLSTFTLHGVRTADVNCNDPQSLDICSNKTADKFLAILAHASSIEAHLDTRVEWFTLQKNSDMPIKAYAVARFGFVGVEGAPRVFNTDAFGVGIASPAGPFRNSSAQVAWGQSDQFQSNPGWNRLKINGSLIFDLMPGFKDSLQFWKRLGASPRMFVSIVVDRNPGGPGPDSVSTYVGVDFDFRHIFFGFGG